MSVNVASRYSPNLFWLCAQEGGANLSCSSRYLSRLFGETGDRVGNEIFGSHVCDGVFVVRISTSILDLLGSFDLLG